jgi:hypothetical protein
MRNAEARRGAGAVTRGAKRLHELDRAKGDTAAVAGHRRSEADGTKAGCMVTGEGKCTGDAGRSRKCSDGGMCDLEDEQEVLFCRRLSF